MVSATSASNAGANEMGARGPVRVVISGAGPAGLVLAHYLMAFGNARFRVSVFDKGEDPTAVVKRGKNNRRYSMSMTINSRKCVEAIPGLLDRVREVAQPVENIVLVMGFNKQPKPMKPDAKDPQNWMVDRWSLCAALYGALMEKHGVSDLLDVNFNAACTGVQLDAKWATFRVKKKAGKEMCAGEGEGEGGAEEHEDMTVEYDLLVGADGLRSAVRMAFQQQMRNFEYEQRDIFQAWQVTHFPSPEGYPLSTLHFIPKVPYMEASQAMAAPAPDGTMCFILGSSYGYVPEDWFACKTPEEAKAYLDKRLPHLQIPEEAAWDLRNQPLATSLAIKCWRYHDHTGHAVLIGDAAHCTCPAIGQGCNASIIDAAVLGQLLLGEQVGEDSRVPGTGSRAGAVAAVAPVLLPTSLSEDTIVQHIPSTTARFSALQVKEGHALVNISDANAAIDKNVQFWSTVRMVVRGLLNKLLPWLIAPPIVTLVATTTTPYSAIYNMFRPYIDYLNALNLEGRRKFYEHQSWDLIPTLSK